MLGLRLNRLPQSFFDYEQEHRSTEHRFTEHDKEVASLVQGGSNPGISCSDFMSFDNLYTAAVAEYLGFANNTLRNWAARRELPMQRNRVNGYRLFKSSDVDKLLEKVAKPVALK